LGVDILSQAMVEVEKADAVFFEKIGKDNISILLNLFQKFT
jgi:hypothetical protein